MAFPLISGPCDTGHLCCGNSEWSIHSLEPLAWFTWVPLVGATLLFVIPLGSSNRRDSDGRIKILLYTTKKSPGPAGFTAEFCSTKIVIHDPARNHEISSVGRSSQCSHVTCTRGTASHTDKEMGTPLRDSSEKWKFPLLFKSCHNAKV